MAGLPAKGLGEKVISAGQGCPNAEIDKDVKISAAGQGRPNAGIDMDVDIPAAGGAGPFKRL